jgi:hypothetical protein
MVRFNKNVSESKIRTVDNLFIFHGKISAIHGLGVRWETGLWFLKSMNNKLTSELLKT